jgi:hypothetical protein
VNTQHGVSPLRWIERKASGGLVLGWLQLSFLIHLSGVCVAVGSITKGCGLYHTLY